MKSLIKKLTETFSPSGYEDAIREVILEAIKTLADEIHVDALGNIIARKGSGGKRIMLAAHMDEIGLMVNHIDEKGFAYFSHVGVPFARYLSGGRVRFMNGVEGIIDSETPKKGGYHGIAPPDKMFIDTGATSPKDSPVQVGDVAAFERPYTEMGKRIVAKSLDDRIGVAVLIEAMRRLKSDKNEAYFVFTVQEEVGVRGAVTAAYGVDPEIGVAIDVTPTGDTPNGWKSNVELGKGPAIVVKDAGIISDTRVVTWLENAAAQTKIPVQRTVQLVGGTDARAMQLTRSGVLAGSIGIPCRYAHSPSEMVDFDDVENAAKLVVALLSKPIEL
ncbi:MAG: M42 family metallopeptidase [Anaerolineales bacterium]